MTPPANFWLAFDLPISKQLQGKITPQDGKMLDEILSAFQFLVGHGVIDGRKRIEKRIVMKAQQAMRRYKP